MFWRCGGGRLARKIQADGAAVTRRESWTSKAYRIATHYLDDPQKWAQQDKYGKGITACQREVEPDFLAGDDSGNRMALVSRAVKALTKDLQANGITATVITSRRDRADAELGQRLAAEREQNAGCSPQRLPDAKDDETGEMLSGGTVADCRMQGKWKNACVKTEAYRSAWKYACRRYAEERVKALKPGAKSGVDFLGAHRICEETRARYAGLGPAGSTIIDAVALGHESPAKYGPATAMPQEVSDYIADIVEVFNDLKLPVFRETIINMSLSYQKLSKLSLSYQDVPLLPEALQAPAKKIFDWWIEAVDKELADDAADSVAAANTPQVDGLG